MKFYKLCQEEIEIPQYLYHATYRPLLRKINQLGLGNTKRKNWDNSQIGVVYLAQDPYVAESYAEEAENLRNEDWLDEIVILRIDTTNLNKENFRIDSNNQQGDTLEYHGIITRENFSIV